MPYSVIESIELIHRITRTVTRTVRPVKTAKAAHLKVENVTYNRDVLGYELGLRSHTHTVDIMFFTIQTPDNCVRYSNGIQLADHLSSGLLSTIWIPDMSGIWAPTVVRSFSRTYTTHTIGNCVWWAIGNSFWVLEK